MNYKGHINIDPRIRSGKPCIRGTRIAVAEVFDYLGGGMMVEEILDDFPDLTAEDIGFKAVENPVSIHDLHATVLHLLGLDHEKLTYRYAGRDFRLTDVYGNIVKDIIA